MISINHDAPLRVAEFYSGIGGMHYALQSSGINYEVVAAFDINCNANAVYQHNFPGTRIVQKGIEHLSPEYFNQLNVDMFIMSPPCQPYTRMGLQLQSQDNRSKSFLYLLQNVVASIENKPRWLLVENVKGFDGSDTRNLTISLLEQCGYSIQEYLLSPVQFGVPNSRLRYYLIAELRRFNPLKCSPFIPSSKIAPVRPLSEFLDSQDGDGDDDGDDRWKEFLLPNEALWRYGGIIDMVNYDSTQSCCFTKNVSDSWLLRFKWFQSSLIDAVLSNDGKFRRVSNSYEPALHDRRGIWRIFQTTAAAVSIITSYWVSSAAVTITVL